MLTKKYVAKNIIFLIAGIFLSLVIGIKYSLFVGFLVAIYILLLNFLDIFYFKSGFISSKKILNKEAFEAGFNIEKTIPFPLALLDQSNILMTNEKFKERFSKFSGKSIFDLIPDYSASIKGMKIEIYECNFLIYTSIIKTNKISKEVVYFVELPSKMEVDSIKMEAVIVSQIIVDNFEDVMEGMEESKKPILVALIDREINSLARQVGGIVKKFEKDKYIFLFSKDKLEYLKEKKFDILDRIREIDMGNKFPVTLSMGIGISDKSLSTAMVFAQQALDLALGRGGDQALIKDKEKFYFYGGIAKEVGSKTRVRARVKAYALGELIEESKDVVIMGHQNADLDCIGSAIGIHTIVRAYGKNSKIVLNKITTSINILYDRLVNEIDEFKDDVFINDKEALEIVHQDTLLIIVDTHRPGILECPKLLDKTKKIVVFDHHRKSTDYIDNAVLNYHEPYASSTSELVTEMLSYTKYPVNLFPAEADALLAGIMVDTKNFAFKTGAKTFEAAAFLRRKGADSMRVRLLFRNKMESYKAKAVAVNNAEIYNNDIAISICPSNIENPSLITAQAADDLLNICGIKASFVLCEEDDKIIISARSLGSINVQVIMEKLGGGGHQTVAGAQVPDMSLEDAIEYLKEAIDKYNMEG